MYQSPDLKDIHPSKRSIYSRGRDYSYEDDQLIVKDTVTRDRINRLKSAKSGLQIHIRNQLKQSRSLVPTPQSPLSLPPPKSPC